MLYISSNTLHPDPIPFSTVHDEPLQLTSFQFNQPSTHMMIFTSVQSYCASSSSVIASSSPQAVITSAVAGTNELLLNYSLLWVIVSIVVVFLAVLLVLSVGMIVAAFVFRRHQRKSRKEMEGIHQWRIAGTRIVATIPLICMCIDT